MFYIVITIPYASILACVRKQKENKLGPMCRLALIFLLLVFVSVAMGASTRERKLLDFGWKFHLGNAADPAQDFGFGAGMGLAKAGEAFGAAGRRFDDSGWRDVNLPHDWVVELPFSQSDDGLHVAHGSKPVGRNYPANSIGWYRRTFDIPKEDDGRRVSVEFDGVYRDSQVWINGHLLGQQPSGYSGFSYDITDYLNYGAKNVLAVRADATQFEGWFYEGGGIYRHVWLLKTSPVHVAEYGTYVTTPDASKGHASVKIQTDVVNDSDETKTVSLASKVYGPSGKEAGETISGGIKVAPRSTETVQQSIEVSSPALWSIETPSMYKLVSSVASGSDSDDYETPFGIRTLKFDVDKGFFLNGKRVEIQGVCNHQDHAGVGSAIPDRLNDDSREVVDRLHVSVEHPHRALEGEVGGIGIGGVSSWPLERSSPPLYSGKMTWFVQDVGPAP